MWWSLCCDPHSRLVHEGEFAVPNYKREKTLSNPKQQALKFKLRRSSLTYPSGSSWVVCVSVAELLCSVEDGVSVAAGGAGLSISTEGVELSEGEPLATVSPLPEQRPMKH